ncbi:MAG: endolytic transglycosylase MltG [bacterium]|nr:endolytic transglycosylase MltG [bacterium]
MKRLIIFFFSIILAAIILTGIYLYSRIFLPLHEDVTVDPLYIKVQSGATVTMIAETLAANGIISNANDFVFTTKLFRKVKKLKAGGYHLYKGTSSYKAMKIIVAGKVSTVTVVIPEGLSSHEIASIFSKKLELDSTKILNLIYDQDVILNAGINANSLEGYLYPDTYSFFWGITEKEAIQTLLNEFHKKFTDSLKQIVMEQGWTLHKIVTLASIIEGEAILDDERPIISAVYHNRLKQGIPLQADPTIQYIIPDGPRRLLKRDLAIDSPYNTYLHAGLPPGPVNNPGISSIRAAINPADVEYIYFVAKGDGSHIFSRTLKEHLAAKAKFDAYRSEISRRKRLENRAQN